MSQPIIHYGRKRSGIRRELKSKIDDWLSTIENEHLINTIKKDVIITGGAIASMLLGEKVNDYDIYFRTKETTLKVANYYVDAFNSKIKIKVGEEVNPYAPCVKEDKITNIKGEVEDRVLIWI